MKGKLYLLTVLSLLLGLTMPMFSQEYIELPVDPKVRYGKLKNGLTYYIRHNNQPKERADFYIVQNVGSILEEENQRGLAHFLEHMAFDGTKNFPDNGISEFTERIGIRLGENMNAYTAFDETVYMLMNAPVTSSEVIDSCLLILHDWSGFITLADSAIEKERGVIREEWRTRQDAQARIWEQQLPKLYPDNRYAERLPIGTIEVIDNFKPDELRAYYKKWYRPDLQAIIIVGDIDVDDIESRIKNLFKDIPLPVNAAERTQFEVQDNEEPLISIATDKEATHIILYLMFKHEKLPMELRGTINGFAMEYLKNVTSAMLNERFSEILQKSNPPFIYAFAYDGDYMVSKTKGAWTAAAVVEEGGIDKAMDALVMEIERAKQFGFTVSEYERARTNLLKGYETAYNERENQKNSTYSNEYRDHFTNGGAIPGIELEYQIINEMAPNITVDQINGYFNAVIGDKNIALALMGPDKEGAIYPTEKELLSSFENARQIPVEPYVEELSDEPLISVLPVAGKIVKTEVDPLFGATVMTLSNDIKVVLKHTEFKKDQIIMTATRPGGTILYGGNDLDNLKVLNEVIGLGGLGNFSATDLNKVLAGKQVSASTALGQNNDNVNGSTVPADIETLFQLIYLNFTAKRMDQEAFDSYVSRVKAQLLNLDLNPMVAFNDTLTTTIYDNNPRTKRLDIGDFDNISYPRIMEIYNERYADASGFVFTFVGNIDIEAMKPYIEQYLASLPDLKRTNNPDPSLAPKFQEGVHVKHFVRAMETPKASVVNVFSGTMEYNLENNITATMLKQILDLVYMEKIRKDEGGTYGVSTSINIATFPEGQSFIQTYFDTDPEKRERMSEILHEELDRMVKEGPRMDDFNKTKENMLKRYAENQEENVYWLNVLDTYYYRDYDLYTNYESMLEALTPKKIQDFAAKLIEQGNSIEVVMVSE